MIPFVFGASHRTAGIELRERIALSCGQQSALMTRLISGGTAREAAVLGTCNRLEIYGVAAGVPSHGLLYDLLAEQAGGCRVEKSIFYLRSEVGAVEHLFRVASSLDSQILGEPHILGQVKECYQQSQRQGAAGRWLHMLFQKSFQVAKEVRSQTAITSLPVSTGSCAVAVAGRICGALAGRRVLAVGAGQIGQAVVRHFAKHGVRLEVANRTRQLAEALARDVDAAVVDFTAWQERVSSADIVVVATGAREPILTVPQARRAMQLRRQRPLLLLDLSVPRNLDPGIGELPSVFLYDIDSVQTLVDAHHAARCREAVKAEQIIARWAAAVWERATLPARVPRAVCPVPASAGQA